MKINKNIFSKKIKKIGLFKLPKNKKKKSEKSHQGQRKLTWGKCINWDVRTRHFPSFSL